MRVGVVLQPRQLQASAAARECDLPDGPTDLGYGGARGGGKSHWGMAQVGADDCQRYPGLKALILRKVGKAIREAFRDLLPKSLGPKHVLGYNYLESKSELNFANGSWIKLGHFQHEKDIDAYLGLEYDIVLIEEATTLTPRKVEDIGSCNRSSKRGWRPRMYYTTNPGGVGHAWFKKRFIEPFRRNAQSDTRFIAATARDNAFNNPEYIRKLERLTGWQRRAWLDGDWDIAAGQYFVTFRREIHVRRDLRLPSNWRVWLALDYGFVHYTAIYLFAEDNDGNVYILDEHAERRWLPQRHVEAVSAMLERHSIRRGRIEKFVAGGDFFSERGDEETIADKYAKLGFKFQRANMDRVNGAAEWLNRLGDPDSGIDPTLFISDRCARLIECIPSLQHNPNRPEDVLKTDTDEDGSAGDDFYDSARYGLMEAAGEHGASEALDYT